MATLAEPSPLFEAAYEHPDNRLHGFVTAVEHKTVAKRFLVTAFSFFLVGGLLALAMRVQLIRPENDVISPETYNRLFTMHGTTMMILFAVPVVEAAGVYLLPLMLGSRDLAFPRLNAFNYWCYLAGGLLMYSSVFANAVPDHGWFAYTPLSGPFYTAGLATDFWALGVMLAEISAIGTAADFITSIFKLRAVGMRIDRMPIFAWALLGTAFMVLVAFPPLVVAGTLLESDRVLGTVFFDSLGGGSPLLWQHLFWIFGHPEVYVMFLPAAGMASQIVQTFSGRPLVGYTLVVAAIVATAFLSLGLWVHHMFTVGLPLFSLALFSAASMTIAIPSGIQTFAWIATLWRGRPRFTTPLLFVVGFIVIFVLGGFTGVMVASASFDSQAHDSYFVVAHFHYTLIGGVLFPVFAGIYYWVPKLAGRLLDERLGLWSFVLMFVGFNVAFFPMHVVGLLGMPRRVYTYPKGSGWETLNLVSSIGAFILAAGILLTLLNLLLLRRGPIAGPNPWGAGTLEWATTSPPASSNFDRLPRVADRNPLWAPESERPEPLPPEEPSRFRMTLATTPFDAAPAEVLHLPAPTLIPAVVPVGLVAAAVGILAESLAVVVAGGVLALVALAAWSLLNEREQAEAVAELSPRMTLPINAGGVGGVGWWGALLGVVVAAVALGSLVFTYFYLQFSNPDWPPLIDQGLPRLPIPAIAAGAALAGIGTMIAAMRSRSRPAGWLAATALLGTVATVLLAIHVATLPFHATDDAFGSAVWALLLFAAAVVGAMTLALIGIAAGSTRLTTERRTALIGHAALLWWFAAVAVIVVFLTVDVSPRLL
jgi:cytochrome c oxidase subunit I+III